MPRAEHRFATAMWHAGRGIAHAALGAPEDARRERRAYQQAAAFYGPEAFETYSYPADTLLAIAGQVLNAGNAAQEHDDDIVGAALLARGRADEAEAVYRRDLEKHPGSGWSLNGLADSLAAQGRPAEAARVGTLFEKAWQRADVRLGLDGVRWF